MVTAREYSKRLGTVTDEQLQLALNRFDLGRLIAAEPAPGGLFGQNIMLTTSAGGYVLRGSPHPGQMERERHAARIIGERTRVPVPWPYLVEDDTSLFGWPYAVMPRLPGLQLADGDVQKTLDKDDRNGIVRALAECLADLHAAPFEFTGVYDEPTGGFEPAHEPFVSWWCGWTRWWLGRCREASAATTEDDVAWANDVIAAAETAIAEPFAGALVHTDFKEGNAVASRVDAGWRITGVFDLAETHVGDGEYDLARAYCEYRARSQERARLYLRTYVDRRPPRPGFERRFVEYVLHDRLIIWEYGQRHGIWFTPGQSLREWLEPKCETAALDARASLQDASGR